MWRLLISWPKRPLLCVEFTISLNTLGNFQAKVPTAGCAGSCAARWQEHWSQFLIWVIKHHLTPALGLCCPPCICLIFSHWRAAPFNAEAVGLSVGLALVQFTDGVNSSSSFAFRWLHQSCHEDFLITFVPSMKSSVANYLKRKWFWWQPAGCGIIWGV